MIRTASLAKVYKNGGVALGDIFDEVTGAPHLGCPFLGGGQGTSSDFGQDVPPAGARVIYATYRGSCDQAIILGVLPQASTGDVTVHRPAVSSQWDYPVNARDVLDWVRQKNGAVLAVTNDGHIVLDTTESGKPVRVQLQAGSPLRISQGGDNPTERLPLAGPLLDKLNELIEKVNKLQESVAQSATVTAMMANPALAVILAGPMATILEGIKLGRAVVIQAEAAYASAKKTAEAEALIVQNAVAQAQEEAAIVTTTAEAVQTQIALAAAAQQKLDEAQKLAKASAAAPTQQAKDLLSMQQGRLRLEAKTLTDKAAALESESTAEIASMKEAAEARSAAFMGKITELKTEATAIVTEATKEVLAITTPEGAVEAFADIVNPPLPMASAGDELVSGAILISSQPASPAVI